MATGSRRRSGLSGRGTAIAAGSVVFVLSANGRAGPEASFVLVPGVPGGSPTATHAIGISGDGSTVFGEVFTTGRWEAMIWTRPGGTRALGPGYFLGGSRDGRVLVGAGPNSTARWTEADGWQAIPKPAGGKAVIGHDVTPDGGVVVGRSDPDGAVHVRAVRWTAAGGTEIIPTPPFNPDYSPTRVSADGRTVVGIGSSGFSFAWRWTQAGGTEALQPFGQLSTVLDMSPDGAAIVGGTQNPTDCGWIMTTGGTVFIPNPIGARGGRAQGVSDDGSVVVGTTAQGAYIWDAVNGSRYISDVLQSYGISVGAFRLTEALEISGDGMTIIGRGLHPGGQDQAWVFTLPAPSSAMVLLAPVLVARRRRAAWDG